MEPKGAKVPVDKQPVTLVVENAATNGQRPLSYVFEVATDADFANKVLSRTGITPGDGRTTMRLPDPLATGRSYYWRARAEDGANTGPYSAPANFDVFTPIVIEAPQLVSPANNTRVTSLRPTFTFNNAPRSGPVGPISYVIEVSDTGTFANKLAAWTLDEPPGSQTSAQLPLDGQYGQYLFWHVRAVDPTTAGPWSNIQAFSMPEPPPPPAPACSRSGPRPDRRLAELRPDARRGVGQVRPHGDQSGADGSRRLRGHQARRLAASRSGRGTAHQERRREHRLVEGTTASRPRASATPTATSTRC